MSTFEPKGLCSAYVCVCPVPFFLPCAQTKDVNKMLLKCSKVCYRVKMKLCHKMLRKEDNYIAAVKLQL